MAGVGAARHSSYTEREPGSSQLSVMSCPTVSLCVAVDQDGNVLTSTDPAHGTSATWTSKNIRVELGDVSCASALPCLTIGTDHDVLTSTDPLRGRSSAWTTKDLDAGSDLAGISCASPRCAWRSTRTATP
jgi:hypothetical protein